MLAPVGNVKALTLYPIKSMRGVSVAEATLDWYGLNGDRKYAFVQDKPHSSFPWLTARELPKLLRCQPHFTQPDKAITIDSEVRVTVPSGKSLALDSAELRAELRLPESVSLLKLSRGTYDCMPVSVLLMSTLKKLEDRLGQSIDPRRFRANILIDDAGLEEEALLGASLRFGEYEDSAQVQVVYKTQRCQMMNLDADTGESDPKYLKEVAASFDVRLGLYASVKSLGNTSVGDEVFKETL